MNQMQTDDFLLSLDWNYAIKLINFFFLFDCSLGPIPKTSNYMSDLSAHTHTHTLYTATNGGENKNEIALKTQIQIQILSIIPQIFAWQTTTLKWLRGRT